MKQETKDNTYKEIQCRNNQGGQTGAECTMIAFFFSYWCVYTHKRKGKTCANAQPCMVARRGFTFKRLHCINLKKKKNPNVNHLNESDPRTFWDQVSWMMQPQDEFRLARYALGKHKFLQKKHHILEESKTFFQMTQIILAPMLRFTQPNDILHD